MRSKGNPNQPPAEQPGNNPNLPANPDAPPAPTPNAPPPGGPLTAAQMAGMTPGQVAAAVRGRVPTVAELRAMTADQSEDFGRFSDAQVQAWLDSGLYDVNVQKFHTAKTDQNGGAIEGWVDKPDDVPDGWEAYGINGARRVGEAPAGGGAGQAQGQGQAAGAANDPRQRFLEELLSQQGGIFSGGGRGNQGAAGERLQGGGVFWNAGGSPAPMPAVAADARSALPTGPSPRQPASPGGMPATPGSESLTGALATVFGGRTGGPSAGPMQPPVPINAGASGLPGAMAAAYSPQRQPRQQQWWRV